MLRLLVVAGGMNYERHRRACLCATFCSRFLARDFFGAERAICFCRGVLTFLVRPFALFILAAFDVERGWETLISAV